MSGSEQHHEWVDDVPLEIGAEFYPLPVVVLTSRRLVYPSRLLEQSYDFSLESSALAYAWASEESRQRSESSPSSLPSTSADGPVSHFPDPGLQASASSAGLTGRGAGLSSVGQQASASSSSIDRLGRREAGSTSLPLPDSALPLPAKSRSDPVQGSQGSLPPRAGAVLRPSAPLSFASGLLQPQPVSRPNASAGPTTAPNAPVQGQLSRMSLEDFEPSSGASPFDAAEIKSIDDRALLRELLG